MLLKKYKGVPILWNTVYKAVTMFFFWVPAHHKYSAKFSLDSTKNNNTGD